MAEGILTLVLFVLVILGLWAFFQNLRRVQVDQDQRLNTLKNSFTKKWSPPKHYIDQWKLQKPRKYRCTDHLGTLQVGEMAIINKGRCDICKITFKNKENV